MKICILMPAHWSGRLGGAEVQARFLIQHLRKATNHDIAVICRHASLTEADGIQIYRIRKVWPISRYTCLPEFMSVHHLLKQVNPDVVYSRVGSPLVGFAANFCRVHSRRLVHHIARLDDVLPSAILPAQNPLRRLERSIYEYGLRHADVVIAQAQYQADLLRQHFDRSSVEIIPNFHPAPATAPKKVVGQKTVLWVANVKRSKRPEAFIEIARRCQHLTTVQFVMAGAISDRKYVPLIAEAQALGNFSYLGPQSLEDVNKLMDTAHIFVNTSTALGEGFPNTFIQSWLRGVPVVSLETDPDSLLANRTLGFSSNNSIDMLVRDLQSLLVDQEQLDQIATRARSEALRYFGADNLVRMQRVLEG